MPSLSCHWLEWWASPYINHFLQPDTIIPSPASPQSWNRYSYVINNPINAADPTGHKCVGEPEECLSEKGTPINGSGGLGGSSQNGGGGGTGEGSNDDDDDDDDEVSITLNRDELDVIEDQAEWLGYYHGQWGQLWGWGVGAVAGVAMLGVDALSCAAAVGSGGTLTGGCIVAIYLTVFAVPAAGIVAGYYGGGIASADSYKVNNYVSEALSDNPEIDQFNVTFKKKTTHISILPGGVGPTYTNYTVQMTGMDSSIVLSGYAGDDVITALFGVSP